MSLSTLLATAAGKAAAGTAIAVLAAGGVAAADAVDLPSQAENAPVIATEDQRDNEHRRAGEAHEDEENETEAVETEELETETKDLEEGPSAEGEANSAFGLCVRDAAEGAGEPEEGEDRSDWTNPAEECSEDHPRQNGENGQAVAEQHRAPQASAGAENGAQGQAIADQHRPAESDEGATETVEEDDEDDEGGPSGRGAEASAAGQANRP